MGTSSSRGSIEEFSIDFTNESEKTIQFESDRLSGAGFPGAPVVKLISVENKTQTLYQKHILFDAAENYIYLKGSDFSDAATYHEAITPEKILSEANSGRIPAGYAKTLANPGNLQNKGLILGQTNAKIIAPPKNIESIMDDFNSGSIIEFLFQVNLENWDTGSTSDDFQLLLGHKNWLDSTDTYPGDSSEALSNVNIAVSAARATSTVEWLTVTSVTDSSYVSIKASDLLSDMGNTWITNAQSNYSWIRVVITVNNTAHTGYSDLMKNFGGIYIRNSTSATDEKLKIANPMIFIRPIGEEVFTGPDLLDYSQVNPNVVVSFREVTRTGMKILSSSPFTGKVKYLVSING